jgi:hypothetical protein
MFIYTVITPTCFGHSYDHLQRVVQYKYKQYLSDYTKCLRKIFQDSFDYIYCALYYNSQSQWPSSLRRGSAANRLLGLRVRVSSGAWMTVS